MWVRILPGVQPSTLAETLDILTNARELRVANVEAAVDN